MIVRDNEWTLGPCLASVRPWVDEIVVVDTGSTDGTAELARGFGARVFHFAWCDDFSAARNESLRHARGEWIFWMDSDETIEYRSGRGLRELVLGTHPADVFGYFMQQLNGLASRRNGHVDVTAVDRVRLFRNRPDLRFEGRVHEQIIPAIRRAGGRLAQTDLTILHSGADETPEQRTRKAELYLRMLEQDLQEKPDESQKAFVLFNLGMTHAALGAHDKAIDCLRHCLSVSSPDQLHVHKAYALLVRAYWRCRQHDAAWETCQAGLARYPADKELLFYAGLLHQHFGRLEEAVQAYLRVLTEPAQRRVFSFDVGIRSFKARQNLALVYEQLGDLNQAESQWRFVVQDHPSYQPGWRGLGKTLIRQKKWREAEQLASQLMGEHKLRQVGLALSSWLREQKRQEG